MRSQREAASLARTVTDLSDLNYNMRSWEKGRLRCRLHSHTPVSMGGLSPNSPVMAPFPSVLLVRARLDLGAKVGVQG